MAADKAFGLDLAGYSTKGSALAKAERRGDQFSVTICRDCPFEVDPGSDADLAAASKPEVDCLKRLLAEAAVFVDVPIDLQGLPAPATADKVWALTKRPIDQALSAMPPLADRIGSYVARMQNLWRRLKADGDDPLGKSLFETYPAGSLEFGGFSSEGYKGEARYSGGQWAALVAKKEVEQKKNNTFAKLLNKLAWTATENLEVRHDEFDAALCALAGICEQANATQLGKNLPQGYVLLKAVPRNVRLSATTYRAAS